MEDKKIKYQYSLGKVSIILLSMSIVVILFSSSGLLNWAQRFEFGTAREFWVSIFTPIDNLSKSLSLNVPKKIIENSFKTFSRFEEKTVNDSLTVAVVDSTAIIDSSKNHVVNNEVKDSLKFKKKLKSDYSKDHPIKVLLIGDSMMGGGLGTLLSWTFRRDTLFYAKRYYELSSGLNRVDVFDWYAKTEEVLEGNKYDILIVNFGTNDVQPIEEDTLNHYKFHNPKWKEVYSKRVDKYLELVHNKFDKIYWLELPYMRDEKFGKRLSKLNSIFKEKVKHYTNISFFPTSKYLTDSTNSFCSFKDVDKQRVRIRMEDGIHYTNAGGKIIARQIRKRILKDLF